MRRTIFRALMFVAIAGSWTITVLLGSGWIRSHFTADIVLLSSKESGKPTTEYGFRVCSYGGAFSIAALRSGKTSDFDNSFPNAGWAIASFNPRQAQGNWLHGRDQINSWYADDRLPTGIDGSRLKWVKDTVSICGNGEEMAALFCPYWLPTAAGTSIAGGLTSALLWRRSYLRRLSKFEVVPV